MKAMLVYYLPKAVHRLSLLKHEGQNCDGVLLYSGD